MDNLAIARVLAEIADLLEIKGENPFKIRAYRNAAEAIIHLGSPIAAMTPPGGDVTGRWDVRIEYAAGSSTHVLHLRQRGHQVDGTHQGDFVARDLAGTINGADVTLRSTYGGQTGDSLSFTFTGKLSLSGNEMSGDLDMGEYLGAKWTAHRRG